MGKGSDHACLVSHHIKEIARKRSLHKSGYKINMNEDLESLKDIAMMFASI